MVLTNISRDFVISECKIIFKDLKHTKFLLDIDQTWKFNSFPKKHELKSYSQYFATTLFVITDSRTMKFSLYCTTTDDSPFFKLSPGICRLAHKVEGLQNEIFVGKPSTSSFLKVQLFWGGHKNLRNLPHSLDICLVNAQTMRKIAQTFVVFSEKLNFT